MKRLKSILLAVVLTVGMALPAVGCDEECEHSVSAWKTQTAATCMSAGVETGVCGKCYETVSRNVPADPNAHVYGAWQIEKPTAEANGSATRICAANSAHNLHETLPALSNFSAYSEKITVRPSVLGVGERTYTYKKNKEITFTEEIPNTGIQTVKDAVDLGSAAESRALVRKAEGSMTNKFFNEKNENINDTTQAHWYEFGDNYTYVYDGTDVDFGKATERWYFIENGKTYGLTKAANSDKVVNDLATGSGDENYLNGSRFYLQWNNDLGFFYGVEDLLGGMYRAARWSTNGDFKEWTQETADGKTEYAFSFGSANNSGDDSGYFSVTSARFTLTDKYSVESLHVQSVIYVNNYAQVDGVPIKTWKYDENGHAVLLPGANQGARYYVAIDMAQTMKAEGDVVPTNPHTFDKMYVQDFAIAYNGQVTDSVTFAANVTTGYKFTIENIQPMSALEDYSFDNFSFYLRTKNEKGEVVDKPLSYGTMLSSAMTVDIQRETVISEEGKPSTKTSFALNSQLSGAQQVVIKTVRGKEKVLHCNISAEAPSKLHPVVFDYADGEYTRRSARGTTTDKTLSATIQSGQPLYFTADVPRDEENYVAPNYTATVTPALTGEETRLMETSVNREAVTQFATDTVGSYTITLTSVLGSQTCTINVTVVAASTFADMTGETYTQELDEPYYVPVTVSFKEDMQEVYDEENNFTGYTITAIISVEGVGVEELTCTYVVENREMTTEHLSGIEAGFHLAINEAYDFVLSYYLEDFQTWETVVLKKMAEA